ncbi:MAG: glycosyltransferase [Sphingobacteriaceae bacterium]|nr:glycosyltransferase [Cytophagaceae bacterium]
MMRVTIITVVRNGSAFVAGAVESVLRQRDVELEYIVVDGGSTDGTLERLNPYVSRFAHFISEPDAGVYAAMNKGLALASGEVIGLLNADDVYEHDCVLREVVETFQRCPEADVVFGNLCYVSTSNLERIRRFWRTGPYREGFFENGHVPPHPAFFARKRFYDGLGGFDEDFRLAADYELMLRGLRVQRCPSVYLDAVLVRMRLGGLSNRHWRAVWRGNREVVLAWRKHGVQIPGRFWPGRLFWKMGQFWKRPG